MIKSIFSLLIFISLTSYSIQAQTSEELTLKTSFWTGMKFFQKGQKITATNAVEIMKSNPSASELLRKSNKQAGGATVVSAIGGFLIGWPVGTAIAGGEPVWELAAVGAGITVVSALIYSSAQKKAKSAVELYNAGLVSSLNNNRPQTEIRLLAKPTQIGFSISF